MRCFAGFLHHPYDFNPSQILKGLFLAAVLWHVIIAQNKRGQLLHTQLELNRTYSMYVCVTLTESTLSASNTHLTGEDQPKFLCLASKNVFTAMVEIWNGLCSCKEEHKLPHTAVFTSSRQCVVFMALTLEKTWPVQMEQTLLLNENVWVTHTLSHTHTCPHTCLLVFICLCPCVTSGFLEKSLMHQSKDVQTVFMYYSAVILDDGSKGEKWSLQRLQS